MAYLPKQPGIFVEDEKIAFDHLSIYVLIDCGMLTL